jgi:Na+-translocating ferredoxin:NAD+ oxidoreductase RnfE subunit
MQALGLTPVIAAATTLRASLWIAALTALHLILCEPLAAALLKKVPVWLRAAIVYLLGLAIACPVTWWLDQSDAASLTALRVFLPLLAANAITIVRCERFAVHHTIAESLRDALTNALGFALAAAVCGAARELLGYGSIWGYTITSRLAIRGVWMPFGGFLMLGAMAAALKYILRVLANHGIVRGAEEAMALAPEDRIERLEKAVSLQESARPEVESAPETERETESSSAGEPAPPALDDLLASFSPMKTGDPDEKPEAVDAVETAPRPSRLMSAEEKARLDRTLNELLEDINLE